MGYRAVRIVKIVLVMSILVLGLSGQWTDPWLLTYLGIWSLLFVYGLTAIGEDLARERFSPPQPGADRASLALVRITALAHIVLGALDTGRWHLFPVPEPLRIAGLLGMAAFGALIFRAMIANRYFSPVVRIQAERGHHLVDRGPYALIRHPGYAGMILAIPCSGLALGSWLAVAFALAYAGLLLRRVVFEDAFLRANLDGYQEYRTRVRYRLVPGVW